jgi:hypothetical protein
MEKEDVDSKMQSLRGSFLEENSGEMLEAFHKETGIGNGFSRKHCEQTGSGRARSNCEEAHNERSQIVGYIRGPRY